MKLLAARVERDADDIAVLLELAGITDLDDALDVVESAYGPDRVPPKTALLLEAILVGEGEAKDSNVSNNLSNERRRTGPDQPS